jgi:hypothetical protein
VDKRGTKKPEGMSLKLIVKDDVEKRTVDFYPTMVSGV